MTRASMDPSTWPPERLSRPAIQLKIYNSAPDVCVFLRAHLSCGCCLCHDKCLSISYSMHRVGH